MELRKPLCRDDRAIHANFIKPAAKKLGIYQKGFGFHELRREAITRWERAPLAQTTKLARHTPLRMSVKYVKQEMRKLAPIVADIEQQFLSGKVILTGTEAVQ